MKKNIGKKLKENWLGFIIGAALTYFVGPQAGLPVIQKALEDKPTVEVVEPEKETGVKIAKPLTDSEPTAIIKAEEKDDEK